MRTTLAVAAFMLVAPPFGAIDGNATLTAVTGVKVGHYTLKERPTGCTVVLIDGDAVGGVSQRGGAPGVGAGLTPAGHQDAPQRRQRRDEQPRRVASEGGRT